MEKTKNKGKKIVLLVCGIVLALAVIAGGAAAVLFMNNGSTSEEAEYSGEVHIQDEQALRAALKSKGNCEIVLSEDVVITKELEVFGDKKLSGGSIIMDMRREGSGESVLAIQKGAKLVLDGTTIDGNSVVNCISVKAGGELDSQSGSLVYGYPYGLNVAGKATITDILIDEALHTGVNVSIFGEVDMLGGTISQNVYGIAVAEEGRMDIADGVTMVKSIASFIINYGKMDIIGGKYEGANDNAIENWGTMDIKGTADKPVEIFNGRKSALNSKNRSKLTVEHVKIYDMGWHGMCIEKNSTANLKGVYLENAGKSTLYVNSSKANLENVTVIGGAAYAVYGTKNAEVTLNHVTIKDINHRGITNEKATLVAENLTIDGTAQHGIYTVGEEAITTVNNVTITNTARSAFAVSSGKGTITNAHIADTTKEAVSVGALGTVIVEDATINNAGNFAIASYGGVAKGTNVVINNSGNASVLAQDSGTFTGDGLTIKNAGKQAIRIEKSAVAKVTNCQIDTTQAASVYVDGGKLTLKSAVINNSKTYGVAAKNCSKANGQIVQLDKVTVNNPGEHGIGSINAYMVAGNIKVTNPRRCGVYSEGAEAIINMAHIEVYNAGTCGLGFKGAAEITARNVTIDKPNKEGIYATSGAIVKKLDNITINNPGTHGVSVDGNASVVITVDIKYNPENIKGNGVTVLNPGNNGIRCSAGTVSAKGVTIKNAGGQGISANKESKVSVNGCTIDTTVQAAVYAEDSKLTMKDAVIDNAGTYAVAAKNCTKEKEQIVQLSDVEINKPGQHGIGSLNAYMVAGNIKVTEPKRCGVYTEGVESIINMANIEVIKAGTSGFGFKGAAEITARNVTIEDAGEHGIYVEENSVVKKLDNITIENPGKNGVYVNGNATVAFTVDTKYNPENTKGNGVTIINPGTKGIRCDKGTVSATGVTIKNTGEHAIYAVKEGKVTVTGCTIDTTAQAAVYAEDASLKLKNATIDNAGTYAVAAKNCTKEKEQMVQLTDVEINKTGEHGIGSINAYMVAGNVKVTEPGRCGVYSEGEEAIINMAGIEVYDAGTCGFGFKGAAEITARNVTIDNPKNEGIYALAGANVKKLDNVTIKNPGTHGISVEGQATVTVTVDTKYNPENTTGNGVTILNPGKYGICIATGSEAAVSGSTVKNAGERAVHAAGALRVNGLTLDGATGHGIYLGANASLSGSDLTVCNTGDNGIFSEGAPIDITGFTLENTKNQGVQVKGGNVSISDFTMKDIGGVAMRTRNDAKVTMTDGTIYAYNYGIYADGTSETTAANVSVERSDKDGKYTTNPLVGLAGSAKVELGSSTKLDGKALEGDGVNVTTATAVFIMNGGTIAGNSTDVVLAKNANVKLQKALTEAVSVKPGEYKEGVVVAEKYGDILDTDFETTVGRLVPVDTDWTVGNNGRLSKLGEAVASIGEITYTTLEAAINAATETDTIKILENLTISATIQINKDVKIAADKAVIVTAADTLSGGIFNVTGGMLNITGTSETAKITIVSGVKTTNMVYNNGGNTILTNVELAGNVDSTAGNNSTYGIYNNAGKVTVKSVTIHDIPKGDGINIRAGASADLDNVTISNTGRYGIKTYGTVNVYNTVRADNGLSITNTVDHGIDIDNGGKVLTHFANVPAGNYAFKIDTTTKSSARGVLVRAGGEFTATDVSIQNVKNNGVDLLAASSVASISNAVIGAEGYAIQTIKDSSLTVSNVTVQKCGTAAVDIKGNLNGEITFTHNIEHVAAVAPTFEAAGNIEYWYCTVCGTVWKDEARTQVITMAETVIPKLEGAVASIGDVKYASLEAAIAAATDADTIKLLENVSISATIQISKNVKIAADKAVTITAADTLGGGIFNVTAGTLSITGASESAKITVASGVKTTNIVYNNGGNVNLTNVELAGNVNSTAGNNSTYGIYNNAGKVTAKSVTICDIPKGDGINIRTGAAADLDNVTITNCSRYGLKTYGTVNVYNTVRADNGLSIANTVDHGIDIDNGGKVLTHFANVPAGTYAFKIDTTTKSTARGVLVRAGGEFTATDVSIQNVKHNGVELLAATSVASITNATIAAEGCGINAAANSSLTLGNVTATGNPAGMNLAKDAKIKLSKALTQNITVQLAEYAEGIVVAEKSGEISDADFAASMAALIPEDTNWVVAATGKLGKSACDHNWTEAITTQPTCTTDGVKTHTCSKCGNSYTEPVSALGHDVKHKTYVAPSLEAAGNKEYWYCSVCSTCWNDAAQTEVTDLASVTLPQVAAGNVAYMNGEAFQTLEAAVIKANEAATADTIYLLSDVTVSKQLTPTTDMTITAAKAVTISVEDTMTGGIFNISGGTLNITGASETAKITIASGVKTTNIVYNNGGNVSLTNVALAGNVNSTAGNNSTYGIYNNAGKVTAKSVTIKDLVKGDGINIRAGASADLDNVTISNSGRYGLKTYGTVNIYNTVHTGHALTIQNSYDHAIDIDNGGAVTSHLTGVADSAYAITIDTTRKSSGMGILVRTGGSLNISNVSIENVKGEGLYFQAGGTVSNFVINGTGKNAIYLTNSASATLNNGTVTTAVCCVKTDAGTTLTTSNVTVQTTGTVAALAISGTKQGDEITVVSAE